MHDEALTEGEERREPCETADGGPEELIPRGRLGCPEFRLGDRDGRDGVPEALAEADGMRRDEGEEGCGCRDRPKLTHYRAAPSVDWTNIQD